VVLTEVTGSLIKAEHRIQGGLLSAW